jgi:hypothetical protein
MSTKYCKWGKHDVEESKWGNYKVCLDCHAKMLNRKKKVKNSNIPSGLPAEDESKTIEESNEQPLTNEEKSEPIINENDDSEIAAKTSSLIERIFDSVKEEDIIETPENEEYNEPEPEPEHEENVRETLKQTKKNVTFQIPSGLPEKEEKTLQIKPVKIAEPNVNVGNFFSQFIGLF